jgi:hypothetical protein
VTKVPGYDPSKDAEAIKKATKGFGTDDAACTFLYDYLLLWR